MDQVTGGDNLENTIVNTMQQESPTEGMTHEVAIVSDLVVGVGDIGKQESVTKIEIRDLIVDTPVIENTTQPASAIEVADADP